MAVSAPWSKRLALATGALVVLGFPAASAPSEIAGDAAAKVLTVRIVNEGALDEDEQPWGSVRSTPPGIDCPPACDASFEAGTQVRLVATAAEGYALSSWNALPNADSCKEVGPCALTIDTSSLSPSVDAFFQPAAGLHAVTAGPGTLEFSPVQPGADAVCKVEAQFELTEKSCDQRFTTGTRVTLTATATGNARFAGWSDYACASTSRRCTVTLAAGERYITARFSPVTLRIQVEADGPAFGSVVVEPGGTCVFRPDSPPCEFSYPPGTLVKMRRQHGAAEKFWIGGCEGNRGGVLDADVCRLRVYGDELVGAGMAGAESIPPVRGAAIEIGRGGNGRGRVTGLVVGSSMKLNCGTVCSISGLSRYDYVRLRAEVSGRNRFVRWSDGNKLKTRVIALSSITRLKATFARR